MPTVPSTLRQIAALAGVSRQTVSDALRGTGRVAPETRIRIEKIAAHLNYSPDPLVSIGLAQMRRQAQHRLQSVLAFVETGPQPGLVKKFTAFQRMMKGVLERAGQLGFGVETFWLGTYLSHPARLEGILRARGIKGVLLLYVRDWAQTEEHPLNFDPEGFACMTIGARLREPELDFASADHFGNTRRAFLELQKLGHRRLGLLIPKGVDRLLEGRITAAYEGWAREKSGRVRLPCFTDFGRNEEDFERKLTAWYDLYRPDAVYGMDIWNLVPTVIKKLSIRLEWASMECSAEGNSWCGIDQVHEAVGAAAVDLVYGQLSHGRYGIPAVARGVLLEGHWINGEILKKI